MTGAELEYRVLGILDTFSSTGRMEDTFVEYKAEWIEPAAAARILAGQANAARGEDVLWIIGVDEKGQQIPGASPEELSNWWAQVQSSLTGEPPRLVCNRCIHYQNVSIVALLFSSHEAPYLFKNPLFGNTKGEKVEREVPWREGNRTRSATHEDLIRILVPQISTPAVEVMEGSLHRSADSASNQTTTKPSWSWSLYLKLYMIPHPIGAVVVIPYHYCSAHLFLVEGSEAIPLDQLWADDGSRSSGMFYGTPGPTGPTRAEIILEYPGVRHLHAHGSSPIIPGLADPPITVRVAVKMRPLHSDQVVEFEVPLIHTPAHQAPVGPHQSEDDRWQWTVKGPHNQPPDHASSNILAAQ